MKTKFSLFSILISTLFFCISCSSNQNQSQKIQLSSIKDIPAKNWEALAQKNIYFGHQSVGSNIVAGIEETIQANPQITLNIDKTNNGASYPFSSPTFLHKAIGKNQDPFSKIDDFQNNIENIFATKPDIAFFKFCFVDFDPRTDIDAVFSHYKNTMASLKKTYPDITFVHVTVPLTCYAPGPSGWVKRSKDIIKKIIGKQNLYDFSSANIYNQKLREEYSGKEPLFDLALFESTYPDGTRAQYEKDNKTIFELVQAYTDDGGHLNKQGRQFIAEQLLIFLAQLVEKN